MLGTVEQVWELGFPLAKMVFLKEQCDFFTSYKCSPGVRMGHWPGNDCWGIPGLDGAALHCGLPPPERTAHHPNPALCYRGTQGWMCRILVLVMPGMFCQEHECTTHTPHPLAVSAV